MNQLQKECLADLEKFIAMPPPSNDYCNDQRTFTDEDLFGLLDLDYVPLKDVRLAVESGDIPAAKSALVSYFRTRATPTFPRYHTDPHWSDWDGATVLERAEAMCDNQLYSRSKEKTDVQSNSKKYGGIDWNTAFRDTHEIKRLGAMATLGYAWELTDDDRQKARIADAFMRWFNGFFEWRPFILESGFDREDFARFGEGINQQAAVYQMFNLGDVIHRDIFKTPGVLPDEFAFHLLKQYFFLAFNLSRLMGSSWRADNHHLMERGVAMVFLGVLYPELKRAADMAEYGRLITILHFENNVLPDDVGNEHCTNYNYRCAVRYAVCMAVSLANGRDIFTENQVERYKNWLTFYAMICAPDGRLVDTGDGRASTLYRIAEETGAMMEHAVVKGVLEELQQAGPVNPAFLARWNKLTPKQPDRMSKIYPRAGHVVMRDGWSPDAMFLHTAIKRDSLYNIHTHWNMYDFTFAANGKRLIGNPNAGTYTYPKGITRGFYFSMDAHNTLIIDDDNLKSHRALAMHWGLQPSRINYARTALNMAGKYDFASFSHPGYDPLFHRRDIIMIRNGYVIMTDAITMDFSNVNSVFASVGDIRPHEYRQRIHFEDGVRAAPGEQDNSVAAQDENTRAGVYIIPEPFENLRAEIGPNEYLEALDNPRYRDYRMADIYRETMGACMFSTIYYPFSGKCPDITVRALTPRTSLYRDDHIHAVSIDHVGKRDIWITQRNLDNPSAQTLSHEDIELKTDAAALFISMKDKRIVGGFMIGGEEARLNGQVLNVERFALEKNLG